MMTFAEITALASIYAKVHAELTDQVDQLQREISSTQRRYINRIKRCTEIAAKRQADLHAAIDGNRQLFEKPRTHIIDGIKFGLTKQKGTIEIPDEAATVARIKTLFKADAEHLLRVVEKPNKQAMADLTVAELKKLGVTVTTDGDKIVITPISGDVDKIVSALLASATDDAITDTQSGHPVHA